MTSCHSIRPLLPARAEELTPSEARLRAEHVDTCTRCATEAAAYSRLGQALAAMANLDVEPADGTLEQILVAIGRRRTAVTTPRVLAAAGASGALVATVVVARAVHHRRQTRHRPIRHRPTLSRPTLSRPTLSRLRLPSLPVPTPALARAK
jgi:anti-sigma factor RsiW